MHESPVSALGDRSPAPGSTFFIAAASIIVHLGVFPCLLDFLLFRKPITLALGLVQKSSGPSLFGRLYEVDGGLWGLMKRALPF